MSRVDRLLRRKNGRAVKSEPLAHVAIAVPVYQAVNARTFMSFLKLKDYTDHHAIPGVGQVSFRIWSQSGISFARHGLLVQAFKDQATHILWLDSDMIFPPDVLHRLFAHGLPVVGANCVRRQEPYTWTAQDKDGREVSSSGRTGLEEVGYLGFGVTLMDLSLFNRVPPPFFNFEWINDDPETGAGHYQGEDIYLFDKLGKVGVHPVIDHDLSREIKHVGILEVGHEWASGWREVVPEGAILNPAVVKE